MKRKLLEKHNRFIAILLSLLGIGGACTFNGCAYGSLSAEYGSPHATFKVHGKIFNDDSIGIPDIQVRIWQDKENSNYHETAYSNAEGTYAVEIPDSPSEKNYKIDFKDVDGAVNGLFQSLDTIVAFKNPEYENGDGDWDLGVTSKEFNIKLKEEN